MNETTPTAEDRVADWWRTEIFDFAPGRIWIRGYPIEELIGRVGFASVIWLMLRGELPGEAEAALLSAALVAGVDHGPHAPSIAIARMAATCGVGLNNAVASAVNVLGDVHGGAGEQAMELYAEIAGRAHSGAALDGAVAAALDGWFATRGRYIPGFGHRFHPVDPRTVRMFELLDEARAAGVVGGRFADIGRAVEAALEKRKGRRIPMNIDGATAVVYSELGFPPAMGRGLFVLARSVGALAHAWEQMCQGGRNKGPIPREMRHRYDGPPPRPVPEAD